MAMSEWSTTAGSNASGVTSVNWAEGQAPSTVNDSARNMMADVAKWYGQNSGSIPEYLTSVSGTNTVTASGPTACAAYAAGQRFTLLPANTNTGATTLNINSIGAKNVFWNGAACVGGEIRQNVPCEVIYDGTQFHIIANGFQSPFLDTYAFVEGSADSSKKARFEADGITTATTRVITLPDKDGTMAMISDITSGVTLGTPVASTSGTSVSIATAIPSTAKEVHVLFVGVSTNGTSPLSLQIGPSGGVVATGYLGGSGGATSGGAGNAGASTTGFKIGGNYSASNAWHGILTLRLENSSSNTWVISGALFDSGVGNMYATAGRISLSGALAKITLTTDGGTDTFDAGEINYQYQ